MKRSLFPKDLTSYEVEVVEWRVIAVWSDGLVEDWSKDLANDSTLAMEIETYCVDYTELRNLHLQADEEDKEEFEYNASEW